MTEKQAAAGPGPGSEGQVQPILDLSTCKLVSETSEMKIWEGTFLGRPAVIRQYLVIPSRKRSAESKTPPGVQMEVRAMLRARKAGVCTPVPYSVEAEAGVVYLEKVAGKTVKELVEGGQMTAEERDRVMADIGKALAQLHDNGQVHSDLRTHHLVVRDSSKQLVVVDLASALITTNTEDKGQDLATLEKNLAEDHPDVPGLFDKVLESYKRHNKQWSAIFNRFADIRKRQAQKKAKMEGKAEAAKPAAGEAGKA